MMGGRGGRVGDLGSWAAVTLVGGLGLCTLVGAGAAASGSLELALWLALVVGSGAVLLLAWAFPAAQVLPVLALTLPLPAIYSTPTLRVSFPLVMSAVLVAAWSLRQAPRPGTPPVGALPVRALAAWMGAVLVASLLAQRLGPVPREVVSLFLLLGILVLATHELTVRPRQRERLASTLGWVAALAGVAALLQALGALPTSLPDRGGDYSRATLGFEWPNEAAMFLAILLPYGVHAFVNGRRGLPRLAAAAGLAVTLAGLAATFSRGSWIAVGVAPLVLLLVGRWRFVFRAWMVAAVAVLAMDVLSGGALSSRVAATLRDPLVGQRALLMLIGLMMFADHPIVGLGPGGYAANLEDYGPQVLSLWEYVGSAHSTYIQMAAETGMLGLGAFLVLLWTIFRLLLRTARRDSARRDPAMREWPLSVTVLWSFATFCLVSGAEWSLTQGVGQAAVLTAALGLALAGEREAP